MGSFLSSHVEDSQSYPAPSRTEDEDTSSNGAGAIGEEEALNRLLQSFGASSDSGVTHMSDGVSLDTLAGYLMDLSSGTSATRPGDSYLRELMASTAAGHHAVFEDSGDIEQLNEAVRSWRLAILLTPDSHADKPGMLSNNAGALKDRFERLGQLDNLHDAIDSGTNAVSLTPEGETARPARLSNLGTLHRMRFEHLGEQWDLDKSTEYIAEAILSVPDDDINKPAFLDNLGASYLVRFQTLSELSDLDDSIECMQEAILLGPDRPDALNNLGAAYQARFERLGNLQDLNQAIDCYIKVISLTADDRMGKPSRADNLGIAYLARFERLGQLVDLNEGIKCGMDAVLLTPDGHISKPDHLSNLGAAYQMRFERLGQLEDINKAIEHGVMAVSLVPDGHTKKPGYLINVGGSYAARFDRLGELPDLSKAIEYRTQAVSLTPQGSASKPGRLSELGALHRTRFKRYGELLDLQRAIENGKEAVLLTPDDDAVKPTRLSNLGQSYLARFERLAQLVDLDKAIECETQATSLTPSDHANKPGQLSRLGVSYLVRFKRLRELPDLNRSINYGEESISLMPKDHPSMPAKIHNLGNAYSSRYAHSCELSDLESAMDCYKSAARSPAGPPFDKFSACRKWSVLASHHDTASPYPAYQQAVILLPQIIWIGTTLGRRYTMVAEIGDFATEAASYAISTNNYELALEWLEVGRSIVWGQIAQLRTPFDRLSAHDPGLACELKEISRKLDDAGSRSSAINSRVETDLVKEANEHIQLALDWDTLLKKARSIVGLEDFLQPPRSAKLLGAARSHPVVVVNVHKSRCDALILQPQSNVIAHIPLTELSVTSVVNTRKHLVAQVRQRKIGRLNSAGSLERSLGDLWISAVKPILDFLGYTRKLPSEELPRLTWCTTGLLSFLPLHAAGQYDGSQSNAMDLVVSSYTPTLSALLPQNLSAPSIYRGILAVSQEHTPGLEGLPCTKSELAVIKKHARANSYLQLENHQATVEQVLDAMDRFSWVHLACHGSQDTTEPTQSAFHLHDGNLTLAMITKRSFINKGLAFLSACQTATGDKSMPEEAVHLAAGMLMAGYPSVIGTMWSIADEDGPKIADKLYASLLNDGRMDHKNAARALHNAVVELRATVGDGSLERWAPFIHIGY